MTTLENRLISTSFFINFRKVSLKELWFLVQMASRWNGLLTMVFKEIFISRYWFEVFRQEILELFSHYRVDNVHLFCVLLGVYAFLLINISFYPCPLKQVECKLVTFEKLFKQGNNFSSVGTLYMRMQTHVQHIYMHKYISSIFTSE